MTHHLVWLFIRWISILSSGIFRFAAAIVQNASTAGVDIVQLGTVGPKVPI
ncbi:hypothetical protein K440DRAFT_386058 [Wilcoxina mikolae CBS 423.85]|nr:hypothetical protein K440DRAFT_386058 [Wilcoxina mikolae CBS 423.85]